MEHKQAGKHFVIVRPDKKEKSCAVSGCVHPQMNKRGYCKKHFEEFLENRAAKPAPPRAAFGADESALLWSLAQELLGASTQFSDSHRTLLQGLLLYSRCC
jgi:hypothetical protein